MLAPKNPIVDFLFPERQQVDQQGRETSVLQGTGDVTIAWTPSAAAASVGKEDETGRAGWDDQVSLERLRTNRDLNRLLSHCCCSAHVSFTSSTVSQLHAGR